MVLGEEGTSPFWCFLHQLLLVTVYVPSGKGGLILMIMPCLSNIIFFHKYCSSLCFRSPLPLYLPWKCPLKWCLLSEVSLDSFFSGPLVSSSPTPSVPWIYDLYITYQIVFSEILVLFPLTDRPFGCQSRQSLWLFSSWSLNLELVPCSQILESDRKRIAAVGSL